MTLSASPDPSVFGAAVTLTAQVTPPNATGRVTFYDGATMLGTGSLLAGTAAISTRLLPTGTRKLKAYYAGDSTYSANTSNVVTQTVAAVGGNVFAMFPTPPTFPGASEPIAVVLADFNSDGRPDLAVGCGDGNLRILLGNGNGTFAAPIPYAIGTGTNQISVATGDFNGDGTADIAVVDGPDRLVTILLGYGNGSFQTAGHIPIADFGSAIAIADFNGDGKADLVITTQADANANIFLGNGDGTFQAGVNYATVSQPVGVAVGDFNGDGKPDLAVSSFNCCNNVSILLGNGDGTFQPAAFYAAGQAPWHVAIGDFNSDGKLDLAVADYGGNAVNVLLGNGDGTFQTQAAYPVGSHPYSVAVGDFNGDGKLDLAVPGVVSNDVSVLTGNGDGSFQPAVSYPAGSEPYDVAVADLTGDGRAELILPDRNASLTILVGATASIFASGGTPQATLQGSAVANPLAVTVLDQNGIPLSGVTVVFSSPPSGAGASLSSTTAITNASGAASVTATANNTPGSYTVTARAGASLAATFSLFTYPTGTSIAVSGGSPQSTQTGTAFAQPLQVIVTDAAHNPIAGAVVVFSQQGIGLPSATLSSGSAVTNASGVASVTATASNITGPYGVLAKLGTLSVSFSLHNLGPTTLTLTSSPNPSAFGAPVGLTTQYTGCTSGGAGTTYYDGVTILATKPGMVNLPISTILLPAGTRKLTAYYPGDSTWCLPGTSNVVTQIVNAVPGAGFTTGTPLNTVGHPGNLAVADFNGDGKADLAFITSGDVYGITVQLGNGDGTFQSPANIALPAGAQPSGIAAVYFGYDGKPGLAVNDPLNGVVMVLRGNGDGTLQPAVTYAVGSSPSAIAIGDFNFDGIADIVTVSGAGGNGSVSVLLGSSGGSFAPAITSATGSGADSSLVVGDFNGDGKADLAVGSFGDGTVNILLGKGDGSFLAPLVNNSAYGVFMTSADVNSDGIADLVTMDGAGSAGVLIGNGDGTFQSRRGLFLNSVGPPAGLGGADFNGDGKPDLAISNIGGGLQFFAGNGDGTFQPVITYSAGSGPGRLVVADFNGDGRADLAVSNFGDAIAVLLGSAAGLNILSTHVDPFGLGQNGAGYSILVSNRASTTFNGLVTVTDTMPSGLTLVGMAGTGWTCPANGNTCTRSDSLAGGASYPAIAVTVNTAPNAPSLVLNNVSVASGTLASVSFSERTNISASPVLSVSTPADAATVLAASAIGYTVTVRNSGSAGTGSANGAALTDALPPGTGLSWTINPAYNGPGTCAITGATGSQTLACNFGVLAAGAAASVHVTSGTSALSCAAYSNTATASASNGNSVQASAVIAVTCPSLTISKIHTGNFVQGQANATYTVVVSNQAGTAPTNGTVTVTDTLPAGMTLVSMAGAGWICPGTAANNCTRSDALAAGASYLPITVTVNVSATAPTSVTNQVSVSGGGSATVSASDVTSVGQPTYLISTLAGRALAPTALAGSQASIGRVTGVATDLTGNTYIASESNVVYKLDSNGILTRVGGNLLAGFSGDNGPAVVAQLNQPIGVAVDGAGRLYIADSANARIRMVGIDGIIVTVAGSGIAGFGGDGGLAISAQLNVPAGVAVDASGNLYITDSDNNRIRKVAADGTITTIAGTFNYGYAGDNGPATSAWLRQPFGVAVSSSGTIYFADSSNHRVRKIASGTITTVAGNGTGSYTGDNGPAVSAELAFPLGVGLDGSGNLYIADYGNCRIREVNPAGVITTVVGTGNCDYSGDGGPAAVARVKTPYGVALDTAGTLYLADRDNQRVRRVSTSGIISSAAGGANGDLGAAQFGEFSHPAAVALDASGNRYIADTDHHRIRRIAPDGTLSTVAGTGLSGYSGDGGPATAAALYYPYGVAVDGSGNLYIADTFNYRIRKVDVNGVITTVAGNGVFAFSGDGGPATSAGIMPPERIVVDLSGNLYFGGQYDSRVRKVAASGIITTAAGNGTSGFSGDGGPATSASLSIAWGLAVDAAGNLYIADSLNRRVRKVDTNGVITTVAGNGTNGHSGDGGPAINAALSQLKGLAVDALGNLYLTEDAAGSIRMVNSAGVITSIAGMVGSNTSGSNYQGDGGPALNATLAWPSGVAVDPTGIIYIADSYNDAIRMLTPVGVLPLLIVNSTHPGNFTAGQSGTYTVIVRNLASAAPTSGAVTVRELSFPATLSSLSGNGWTCNSSSCTRTDALAGGASYPPITVTVNVPTSLPTQITHQLTVSGGGGVVTGTNDLTVIIVPPRLAITKTHTGTFAKGQAGAYSVTVSNAVGVSPTSGTVTVTETVPAGMTLMSMAGSGWSCPGGNTCTTANPLAGGMSYPPITVTVNVAGNAASPQVNAVAVSGGGSTGAGTTDSTVIAAGTPKAVMTTPVPGSTLSGTPVTFTWSAGTAATAYWLDIGTVQGQGNIFAAQFAPSALSQTVNGIPLNGGTIYARLWTQLSGVWQYNDYSYTAANAGGSKALMSTPVPGTTLSGSTVTFTWSAGTSAAAYWLDVGTIQGQGNISAGQLRAAVTSHTVSGIPTSGSAIYVRLWTQLSGVWQYNDYSYTAANTGGARATMSTPVPNTTLTGSTVTFTWTAVTGASAYWLDVGTVQGQGNIFGQNVSLANTQTVSGIPTNGGSIYVKLWTQVNGNWTGNPYTYTAANLGTLAVMNNPAPGSTLSGSSVTFTWTAGAGASAYWLDVGTIQGQGNISAGQLSPAVTSQTVSGIPTSGSTLYVRLWTQSSGVWQYNDYSYAAASTGGTKAVMSTPVPTTALTGSTVTFTWSAGTGASAYWLDVGTIQGQGNVFAAQLSPSILSQTVNAIPANGSTIYVRLWTQLGGVWQYNDYTYAAH